MTVTVLLFTFFLVPALDGCGFFGAVLGSLLGGAKKRRAQRAERRMERARAQMGVRQSEIARARLEREIPIQRGEVSAAASSKTGFTGSASGPGEWARANFEQTAAEARELAGMGVDVAIKSRTALRAAQSYQKLMGRLEPWILAAEEFERFGGIQNWF